MDCAEYQRSINRFVDHEIKATECSELFQHLGICAGCRTFYDSIIMLGAELDKDHLSIDETLTTSSRLSHHLVSHIADQTRMAPRPSTLAFIIAAVLAVSLLFSINVTIENPAPPTPLSAMSQ